MRWVRCNRRFGSLLALFALGVQLVLAFGHVHGEAIRGAPTLMVGAAAPASPPAPAPHPGDDNDDYCAICASIYLAANSFIPQAPLLAVPLLSRPIEHVDRLAAAVFVPRRTSFQSRGPPLA